MFIFLSICLREWAGERERHIYAYRGREEFTHTETWRHVQAFWVKWYVLRSHLGQFAISLHLQSA